ncbi:lipocalin family protein [Aquimarina sp. MMG016]|uniref:lipocalin family protein n=1 Tax=Aquimarina sp. MMG016 TaxID=2822690 RepID=UPI001B39DAA8|nr:lipocalin family protein [Aquimarina sp. MMG016]MBQ4821064.1 lipocalin family protein [Aquimarina sp. MMG016]
MKQQALHILLVFILISNISCTKADKDQYRIPENSKELISGITGKTWKIAKRYNNGTRMNMGDCFLSYRITYNPDTKFRDNNGEYENCGVSMIGSWEIIKDKEMNSYIKIISDQIPELMNMDRNYKYLKILQLNKDTLKLQFRHKQFNNTKTTIVDTYVSEDIEVKDRDFHW